MPLPAPDWIFLDLDNTLWDFDGNAEEALQELFHRHHLHLKSAYDAQAFVALYKSINDQFWRRYESGEIGKDFLRTQRFTQTFMEMGIPPEEHPESAWEEYLAICPTLKRMIPGAMELLEITARNGSVAIITNGFDRTQNGKISASGIDRFIRFMVNSEAAGYAKPQKEIFEHALKQAGISAERTIYIGDTLRTDILGSLAAGIPVWWFNPLREAVPDDIQTNPLFLGESASLPQLLERLSDRYGWL